MLEHETMPTHTPPLSPPRLPPRSPPQHQKHSAVGRLHIVHVDASLLIVDKPAGLLSVPGLGEAGRHNLAQFVQAQFEDALVVHRLDMATSGLMVFARGASAHRQLSMAFADRQVHKRYEAVCEGLVPDESGSINLPLIADWPRRPLQKVDHVVGKSALTHWRVLHRGADSTRLDLRPITGRSHQLRVHLHAIGHPIRGDALYAPSPLLAPRLLLHATHLAFAHPLNGESVAFESAAEF
jgi:tRNA pseudouridine32 synthase / 23S rRNA pseudouridine746 synthase